MAPRTPAGGGPPGWRFVSEPVEPEPGRFAAGPMAAGAPGLPLRFRWRGEAHEVARVLAAFRETGPCRHGSGERYARRHVYRVLTAGGLEMQLYFERQPRGRGGAKRRWWLARVRGAVADGGGNT